MAVTAGMDMYSVSKIQVGCKAAIASKLPTVDRVRPREIGRFLRPLSQSMDMIDPQSKALR
ncbi:hypothetical protein PMHK_35400 [Pseudomonas sp. MHK4]